MNFLFYLKAASYLLADSDDFIYFGMVVKIQNDVSAEIIKQLYGLRIKTRECKSILSSVRVDLKGAEV